jgi:sugar O-acyltransferase (sialic acid O-acetyltransferase NeuD family)
MVNNNKLLILGAGGHGRVIAEIAMKMKKWDFIGFIDDDDSIKMSSRIPVIGNTDNMHEYIGNHDVFVAIGDNKTRERIQTELESSRTNMPILIHPSAIIGEKVVIGKGTAIMAGVIINCGSSIGKGCIINTGVTIDHDNVIGNYVHISPGASIAGGVNIGKSSWIGIGSAIINNINIAEYCIIGAGAVVTKDIPANCTAVGVPAVPVKFHD